MPPPLAGAGFLTISGVLRLMDGAPPSFCLQVHMVFSLCVCV